VISARARSQIAALGTERSTDVDAFKLASLTQREQFYSNVLRDLLESDLPFMIGGGCTVNLYTHARCPTKDLDIFTTAAEFPRLLSHLQRNKVAASAQLLARRRDSSQSQSGRISAPFRPHAWQTNSGSRSDSRTWSGHRSAPIRTAWAHL